MSGIVEVENLSFSYTPESTVLEDISFAVRPGTFLAIAGPNGAGKTTLLNLLCGGASARTGRIMIDAVPVASYSTKALAEKVAVVRQGFVPMFGFSVIETVMMARTRHFGAMGFERIADTEIVNEALELTDTAQFASRPLGNLSTGERQRVFIARAFAQETPILLLDEPTNFLDLKHQVGIYDLLKAAQRDKDKTVIVVTHDINLAAQYCDQVLLLGADGSYRFGPVAKVLSAEQIEKVFSVTVFAGLIGKERFFIPLGKLAKDRKQINTPSEGAPAQDPRRHSP
ncbi:MAG: ABC transporter ATP-binding protein [Phycisphaerae bacterium]|nr:ABC transporter ATP-binding protein [Phycisphaerae bacterium]